eukprot:2790540-Prymnesium_polylepis.1
MHFRLLAASVCVGVGVAAVTAWRRVAKPRSAHPPGSRAQAIERDIRTTQRPAAALGIAVHTLAENSLSLCAPLNLNYNVHGTAFAGSLYAVGALCAYYLGKEWLLRRGLTPRYELVAKAGSIQYRRPVVSESIVAESVLPSLAEMDRFLTTLQTSGKATVEVCGRVMQSEDKVAVEYKVELCAFLPRPKT